MSALAELGRRVGEFARAYTTLTEGLMAQGVPEEVARREARSVALAAALYEAEAQPSSAAPGERCPLCGRGAG